MIEKKRKISLLVALVLLIMMGAWFFFEDGERVFISENDSETVTKTGNLIIGSEDAGHEWKLSYEEPGKPGLVINIITETEKVNCIGDESCVAFFTGDESIVGSRVELSGVLKGNDLTLDIIEFVEDEVSCNFDFEQFTVSTIYEADQYEVDFSTRPEAETFRTRITETAEKGVNFAGRYAYAEWGCGTNCGAGAIVDVETGEIVEYGLMNTHGVDYREDSRLLIVNPPQALEYIREGDLFSDETSKYYLVQDGSLLLLCEE